MTPRYSVFPATHHDFTFLGGFERFDLWWDTDGDLRIVWGTIDPHWHYVVAGQPYFGLNRQALSHDSLRNKPTRAEMQGIKQYIKVFAPDYWEALRIGEGEGEGEGEGKGEANAA